MRITLLLLAASLLAGCQKNPYGEVIADRESAFSHLRVRALGSARSLHFVAADGKETTQSALDLDDPGRLLIPYTRYQFLSLLYREPQERILIVGLGGGAMVRFLQTRMPATQIDVVEIDPAVVAVAAEFFGTNSSDTTKIFTEDAFEFLKGNHGLYDVIYMDAFLSPEVATDDVGMPLTSTQSAFLRSLHRHVQPGGAVVFNLIESPDTAANLSAIRDAFEAVDIYPVAGRTNITAVALPGRMAPDWSQLGARAREIDATDRLGFSLAELLDHSASSARAIGP